MGSRCVDIMSKMDDITKKLSRKQWQMRASESITYCSVGAHHQNVIAEARIKHLTLAAQTMLIHAKRYCPEDTTTMFWPYAIKASGACQNRFFLNNGSLSPLKLFSAVKTNFDLKLEHTWGYPTYILGAKL